MTAQRQQRNPRAYPPLIRRGLALFALLAGLCAQVLTSQAATTELIVTNRFSGLAISGFDPVAYFVDGKAVAGLETFEAWQGGVVWRFHNEGNRAFFLAHPEIYGPQFGGYDPADIARGVVVAGNPRFFVISEQRLYLFGREDNRDAFAANPERFLYEVGKRWPALQDKLSQ
jgi:hypothetical protein